MREYGFQVFPALRKGLRPFSFMDRNGDWFSKFQNLRVSSYGAIKFVSGTNPATLPAVSFPFPQVFNLSGGLFCADDENIYTLDSNTLARSAIDFRNPQYPAYSVSIPADGVWHVVDFDRCWAFYNGSCVAYRSNVDTLGQTGGLDYYAQTTVPMQTGCNFRGQLITGGALPGQFWTADWSDLLEDMATRVPHGLRFDLDVKSNFVFWSQIGGGDLLWLLDPTKAITSDVSSSEYGPGYMFWYDMFKRGDAGFMALPSNGTIRVIKQLGNRAVVYTTDGIYLLTPAVLETGIPTFGMEVITKHIGVASRSAVAGDTQRHYFVDQKGELFRLTSDTQLTNLRYSEFITSLNQSTVVLNWNETERELYISGSSDGLVYSEFQSGNDVAFGMAQTTRPIISCMTYLGTHYFVQPTAVAATDGVFELTTDTFDLGNRNQKTVQSVQVGYEDITNLQVKAAWKNSSGSFSETGYISCNPEGFAIIPCAGVDLRVSVKGTIGSNARIDYITVNWKQTDKRDIRGVLANRGVPGTDTQSMG